MRLLVNQSLLPKFMSVILQHLLTRSCGLVHQYTHNDKFNLKKSGIMAGDNVITKFGLIE